MQFQTINKYDILISLAKISSIKWDTLAFLKGGAMKGTNHGIISEQAYVLIKKAEVIITSVLGTDPSVLEPGYYTKRTQTPMQKGWKWNSLRKDWGTLEDCIKMEAKVNPKLKKFSTQQIISEMPQVSHFN